MSHIFRIKLDFELKLKSILAIVLDLGTILTHHLFIVVQPSVEAFSIAVLQSKVHDFPKANGLGDLLKEQLTSGIVADIELQLRVRSDHLYRHWRWLRKNPHS